MKIEIELEPKTLRHVRKMMKQLGMAPDSLPEIAGDHLNGTLENIDTDCMLASHVYPSRADAMRVAKRLLVAKHGRSMSFVVRYWVRGKEASETVQPDMKRFMRWHRRHKTELWRNTVRQFGRKAANEWAA